MSTPSKEIIRGALTQMMVKLGIDPLLMATSISEVTDDWSKEDMKDEAELAEWISILEARIRSDLFN